MQVGMSRNDGWGSSGTSRDIHAPGDDVRQVATMWHQVDRDHWRISTVLLQFDVGTDVASSQTSVRPGNFDHPLGHVVELGS